MVKEPSNPEGKLKTHHESLLYTIARCPTSDYDRRCEVEGNLCVWLENDLEGFMNVHNMTRFFPMFAD